jgi:hypothetical protein
MKGSEGKVSCIFNLAVIDFLDIAQLLVSFYLKQFILNKNRTMNNVQKVSNYINIPSSQTFRSISLTLYGPI